MNGMMRLAPEIPASEMVSFFAEHAAARSRAAATKEAAVPAYERLLKHAEEGLGTNQEQRIAAFLAADFNGRAHPFTLSYLGSVDTSIADDIILCIQAIAWGAELHTMVREGEQRVKRVLSDYGLITKDTEAIPPNTSVPNVTESTAIFEASPARTISALDEMAEAAQAVAQAEALLVTQRDRLEKLQRRRSSAAPRTQTGVATAAEAHGDLDAFNAKLNRLRAMIGPSKS